MRAATLFSGIGAPEQARPDWQWLWHAEIEPFPAAVLAARHPGSVNLGDVSADDFAERAERVGRPDILVFGSPCQSFSVAGKRLGLSDPRGNLALVALALVGRLRPRWFVFENVPGLLSSDGGRDFQAFLGAVAECGYFGSWRVLDARYWGLAQRRERVFFVGSLGDWRGPAAVLSLAEGLHGYPEKSREAGPGSTVGTLGGTSPGGGWRVGADEAAAGQLVAHTLRADGFDASEDGTGRGTPLVPVAYGISADCLDRDGEGAGGTAGERSGLGIERELTQTLRAKRPNAVAFNWQAAGKQTSLGCTTEAVSTLSRSTTQVRRLSVIECARLQGFPDTYAHIITKRWRKIGAEEARYLASHGLPVEERAGRWYTPVPADGPMYKAYGNSMAVPVLRWLLTRIEAHDAALRIAA